MYLHWDAIFLHHKNNQNKNHLTASRYMWMKISSNMPAWRNSACEGWAGLSQQTMCWISIPLVRWPRNRTRSARVLYPCLFFTNGDERLLIFISRHTKSSVQVPTKHEIVEATIYFHVKLFFKYRYCILDLHLAHVMACIDYTAVH